MNFFSQNDKRWAGKPLGHSKFTIGNSGCLVTAVQNGLIRQGFLTDPGIFVNWGNTHGAFQDPLGFLVFGSIYQYTKKKFKLVEGNAEGKLNTLHEVIWTLNNGTKTTHWVDQDFGRDLLLSPYVIDSWDGKRKSLRQPFWRATGRKLYIKRG